MMGDSRGLDYEAYLDEELVRAPRHLTDHLFHYTNADAAISGILRSGELRLSPFDGTNDLWESRPLYPNVSIHGDDLGTEPDMGLWEQVDRHIRRHAKVACLTQDWEVADHVLDPDALRGWSHLSLWAHYGGAHSGVCLRFDRYRLVKAFQRGGRGDCWHFDGPVRYARTSVGIGPTAIDMGQMREFGIAACSVAFAVSNQETIFFRKHADWANESEYRLVLLGQEVVPEYIDIGAALTGVVLGESFPLHRMPELRSVLTNYRGVEVLKIAYHNRRMFCMPLTLDGPTPQADEHGDRPSGTHQDSLAQRVSVLLNAEQDSQRMRVSGSDLLAPHVSCIEKFMAELCDEIATWNNVDARVHRSITAVPVRLRSRAPGVPGERVHYEAGAMSVGENVPPHSHTFVAAAAIQLLDDEVARLHAVVTIEHWRPDGNVNVERWRAERELALTAVSDELPGLLLDLRSEALDARHEFDKQRRAP